MTIMAPFHPYVSIRLIERGAKTKVPTPEPHEVKPVASALLFSK